MKNLISKTPNKAIEQIGLENYKAHCGMLSTPFTGYDLNAAAEIGVGWALDNGCFLPGYNPKKILRELEKWQGLKHCLFAVLPDVIQNHKETLQLSMSWISIFHGLGYPPAFVLQDGCTKSDVPYCEIATVFIGGSDTYKKSQEVRDICLESKTRGLHIHHGRVGGRDRLKYSRDDLEVDSVDSTGYSIYPPKIKEDLSLFQVRQLKLFSA